jgi:hypothetical protein
MAAIAHCADRTSRSTPAATSRRKARSRAVESARERLAAASRSAANRLHRSS